MHTQREVVSCVNTMSI